MLITFVDGATSPAVSTAPTYYFVDTSSGVLQFVSGGASAAGTISLNGIALFTPGSVGLWAYLQTQVTLGLQNDLSKLSFVSSVPPSASAATASISGGTMNVTGTGFQPGCWAILDYAVGSALSVANLGTATFILDTSVSFTVPATSAGTYKVTLFNPDGGYVIFGVTTS